MKDEKADLLEKENLTWGVPPPPEQPKRPLRPGGRGFFWIAGGLVVAAAVLFVVLNAWLSVPRPISGTSGTAYGKVLSISNDLTTATVRLDGGTVVVAQTGAGAAESITGIIAPPYQPGERVQLAYYLDTTNRYVFAIADYERSPTLLWLVFVFIAAIAVVGRGRSLRSLLGTAASVAFVLGVILPGILHGGSPILLALVGSVGVLVLSSYLVDGVTWKTTAATLGALVGVGAALAMGALFLTLARVTGFGTEDSIYLASGGSYIDVGGLVLATVAIGALGGLMEIAWAQVEAIPGAQSERKGFAEFYRQAIAGNSRRIGSVVNTLLFAYLAADLPVLALIAEAQGPIYDNLNIELVAVGIVQALVGAIAVTLAAPATILIVWFLRGGRQPRPVAKAVMSENR